MTAVDVLVLPGLGCSGPRHWQTLWEARYGYRRLEQQSWDRPDRAAWLAALERAVASGSRDLVLVAHSLACAAVAHFAAAHAKSRVVGALLVAPADVDSDARTPVETRSFRPMPLGRLPFLSAVVASTTDDYVDRERARFFAAQWGAEFVDVGAAGHINADAGFGDWPFGHAILERLLARVKSR